MSGPELSPLLVTLRKGRSGIDTFGKRGVRARAAVKHDDGGVSAGCKRFKDVAGQPGLAIVTLEVNGFGIGGDGDRHPCDRKRKQPQTHLCMVPQVGVCSHRSSEAVQRFRIVAQHHAGELRGTRSA